MRLLLKSGSCISSTSLLQRPTSSSASATLWPRPMLCTISGFTSYAMFTLCAIFSPVIQLVAKRRLGSDEADDGSQRICGNAHLSAADALYVSGPRTAPAPSFYAVRNGRTMAASLQAAQRRNTLHYGVKVPSICTSFRMLGLLL